MRDLPGRYFDETATPEGLGQRLHLRGCELWAWGANGGQPKKLETFETETEAKIALEECLYDVFVGKSNDDLTWFFNLDDAEEFIRENTSLALAYQKSFA
jgi:hypothetical protein